jgi:hypothetical protein
MLYLGVQSDQRHEMSVTRFRVKWDENEIPDGYYVRALDYDNLIIELAKARRRIQELEAERCTCGMNRTATFK